MREQQPIGVFDSGIGGLTVLAELMSKLPGERFIYLGDTARLPYGTKSPTTVMRYAVTAGHFLARRGVKLLVVACHTATAMALPALRSALSIPVVGVLEPAARAATEKAKTAVGVIGTESTIGSGIYQHLLQQMRPDLVIHAQPCPLFVPLAEEGWFSHPVTQQVAEIYLKPLKTWGVDTVILGCTHYPLLVDPIRRALGPEVQLINSGEEVAREVALLLSRKSLLGGGPGGVELLVTDAAPRVQRLAQVILGEIGEKLKLVDMTEDLG